MGIIVPPTIITIKNRHLGVLPWTLKVVPLGSGAPV